MVGTGNDRPRRFDFDFDPRFRGLLRLSGVSPRTAVVRVHPDRLHARFGPVAVETPLDNVRDVRRTGPYRWYRTIGIRLSLVDRGLTFGSSVDDGVCIRFHRPVAGLAGIRHPGLTVTVADPDALVTALRAAHQGIDR
jgi:hypothetical protein